MRWEVFDPRDGRTLTTYRFKWRARLATRVVRGLDYAEVGQGWV